MKYHKIGFLISFIGFVMNGTAFLFSDTAFSLLMFRLGCLTFCASLVGMGMVYQAQKHQPSRVVADHVQCVSFLEPPCLQTAPTRKLTDKELCGYFKKDFETIATNTEKFVMDRYYNSGRYSGDGPSSPLEQSELFIQRVRKLQKDGLL